MEWSWHPLTTWKGQIVSENTRKSERPDARNEPIPISARRTMSGILLVTKPAPRDRTPSANTPLINAISVGYVSSLHT